MSVFALAFQALVLGLVFLGGNATSIAFGDGVSGGRNTALQHLAATESFGLLKPSVVSQLLVLDWLTTIYLIVALGALAASYVMSFRDDDYSELRHAIFVAGCVVATPAILLGGLAVLSVIIQLVVLLILFVFYLFFSLLAEEWLEFTFFEEMFLLEMLGVVLVSLIYLAICQAGAYASVVVAKVWRVR